METRQFDSPDPCALAGPLRSPSLCPFTAIALERRQHQLRASAPHPECLARIMLDPVMTRVRAGLTREKDNPQ